MKVDGNTQLLADTPHRIPIRVSQMRERLGHLHEDIDSPMAARLCALDLSRDSLRITQVGKDRHWQITITGARPLAQRIVVGAHYRQLELGISKLEEGAARRIGKEYLGVDTVGIQRLQALPGLIGRPWHFVPPFGIGGKRLTHHRGTIAYAVLCSNPVDAPTIDAAAFFLNFHYLRDTVSPFASRHPAGEVVALERCVRVCAN